MQFFLPFLIFHTLFFSRIPESTSDSGVAETKPVAPSFFLGGIQVNEANHHNWTKTLKNIGMNTVEVTVYAKQGDWDSDNLWYDEIDEGVISEIRAARKQGLNVVLILRVALDHAYPRNKFLWHGMILPKNDTLIDSWFHKYGGFVNKWANISANEGVSVLAIGSEMNALSATIPLEKMPILYRYYKSKQAQNIREKRVLKFEKQLEEKHLWVRGSANYKSLELFIEDRIDVHKQWADQITFKGEKKPIVLMNQRRKNIQAHWEKIILDVRSIYNGKLTYAANFDNYFDVGFWNHLDFMGINAYFPLRNPDETYPTTAALKNALQEGWKNTFSEITLFQQQHGIANQPIFFTELGYINRNNTTLEPWSGFGFSVVGSKRKERLIVWNEETTNPTERAMAVNALYEVVTAQNINLSGILYWKLTTHDYHLPIEPFALHISTQKTDELQSALTQFTQQ